MASKPLIALEAASASITTASVTIKTLRVNSRQLTMGTFRQLPRRTLVDEPQIVLLGTVWGWVNYNPDGDPKETQFVVQFGEELCRCPFWVRDLKDAQVDAWPRCMRARSESHERDIHEFVISEILRETRRFPEDSSTLVAPRFPPFPGFVTRFGSQSQVEMGTAAFTHEQLGWAKIYLSPMPMTRYVNSNEIAGREVVARSDASNSWVEVVEKSAEAVRAAMRDKLRGLFYQNDVDVTPERWGEMFREDSANAWAYIRRWNDLMDRLRSVGQLFIAT